MSERQTKVIQALLKLGGIGKTAEIARISGLRHQAAYEILRFELEGKGIVTKPDRLTWKLAGASNARI